MHYIGGGLILAGLMVDLYLGCVIVKKEDQIRFLRQVRDQQSEKYRELLARIPPSADDPHDDDFNCGFHFHLWNDQHLEIRCKGDSPDVVKLPLHVREDGAVEVATNGKVLILIHKPPDKRK